MTRTTKAHVALAKIHNWITRDGLMTGSAALLRTMLLSMAGHGSVKLLSLNILDDERRAWLSDVIEGFHQLTPEELISAAGGLEDSEP